jgi:hypothetical protein
MKSRINSDCSKTRFSGTLLDLAEGIIRRKGKIAQSTPA